MTDMKIFVPKFRHEMPHIDPAILTAQLVEVRAEELKKIIANWEAMDVIQSQRSTRSFFKAHIREICDREPLKGTLEPFLRRPHITLHGGSKDGNPACADQFQKSAYQSGYLAAKNGFNGWYGGGDGGLMGQFAFGFNAAIAEFGRKPDQYLLQFIPAPFVFPKQTQDAGLRPANEGLCTITDAAIIMPDFDTRLHLLNSRSIAAISNPGGSGSGEEIFGVLRGIKTGLLTTMFYVLNQRIEDEFGGGYYDDIIQFMKKSIARGLENPRLIDKVAFMRTVSEIYEDLIGKLTETGRLPDQLYAEYCQRNDVEPGVPKLKVKHPDYSV